MSNNIVIKNSVPFKSEWFHILRGMRVLLDAYFVAGIKNVSIKNFNQDCLEFFFEMIRHYSSCVVSPNLYQFAAHFKPAVLNNLVVVNSAIVKLIMHILY